MFVSNETFDDEICLCLTFFFAFGNHSSAISISAEIRSSEFGSSHRNCSCDMSPGHSKKSSWYGSSFCFSVPERMLALAFFSETWLPQMMNHKCDKTTLHQDNRKKVEMFSGKMFAGLLLPAHANIRVLFSIGLDYAHLFSKKRSTVGPFAGCSCSFKSQRLNSWEISSSFVVTVGLIYLSALQAARGV